MLHSWSYYPSTLPCSLCLRLEKNKYTFGSVGVFHQQGPCTWSLPCPYKQVHLEQNMVEFYNSQIPPSEGPGSTSTNTLSKILPTPHFELLDNEEHGWHRIKRCRRQGPHKNQMTHLKNEHGEKSCSEGLKTLNPRRKVKSVVIHIYPFCIPFSF